MIVKKTWKSKKMTGTIFLMPAYFYTGYFLLGIIPLYISRQSN